MLSNINLFNYKMMLTLINNGNYVIILLDKYEVQKQV